jgi:hypothetical protein
MSEVIMLILLLLVFVGGLGGIIFAVKKALERGSTVYIEEAKGMQKALKQVLDEKLGVKYIRDIINQDYGRSYPINEVIDFPIPAGLLILPQFLGYLNKEFTWELIYNTNSTVDFNEFKDVAGLSLNDTSGKTTIFKLVHDNQSIYFIIRSEELSLKFAQDNYEIPDNVLHAFAEDGNIQAIQKIVYFSNPSTWLKKRALERFASRVYKRKDVIWGQEASTRHLKAFKGYQDELSMKQVNVSTIEHAVDMDVDLLYEDFIISTGGEQFEVRPSQFVNHYLEMTQEPRSILNQTNIHIKGDTGVGKTRFVEFLRTEIDQKCSESGAIITINAKELNFLLSSEQHIQSMFEAVSYDSNGPIYLIVDEADQFYKGKEKTEIQSVFLELLDGTLAREYPMHTILISNLTEQELPPYYEREGRIDFTVTIPANSPASVQKIVNEHLKEHPEAVINYRKLSKIEKEGKQIPLNTVFASIIENPKVTMMRQRVAKVRAKLENMKENKEVKEKPKAALAKQKVQKIPPRRRRR